MHSNVEGETILIPDRLAKKTLTCRSLCNSLKLHIKYMSVLFYIVSIHRTCKQRDGCIQLEQNDETFNCIVQLKKNFYMRGCCMRPCCDTAVAGR